MTETINLREIQTIGDYKLICDRFPKEQVDQAWESLSEAEKERITAICSGEDVIAQIITELQKAQSLADLQGIKARFEASLIKRAWNEIKRQNIAEFNRLNALCTQPPREKKPMESLNLADLNTEAQALFNDILDNLEDEENLIKLLETIQDKVDATAYVYDAFDVEIISLKARREAILDKIDRQILAMENAQKAITNRLIYWHQQGKIGQTLVGNERKITLRNYQIVECDNPDNLPDEYKSVKTTVSAKKDAIKKALKEGKDLGLVATLKDNFRPSFGYNRQPKAKKK